MARKVVKRKTHKHSSSTVKHKAVHHKTAINKTIHKHHVSKQKILHKHYSKKFCPNCGNIIDDDNTLCKDCRVTDFNFKDIKLLLCNKCKSFSHKNKWQSFHDLNDAIKTIVKDNVKEKVSYIGIDDNKVEELLSYKAGVHREFSVEVSIGTEKFDLPATLDVTLCPKCCKQGTKYFEGILQVRNINKEIYDFIKNDLAKNKSRGVHLNKEIEIDDTGTNIDLYYTDKGYMKIIAEKLRTHFGAIIKHNAQLFSINWETSKNLYRLNVLVEFPKYKKNDVLKVDGRLYKVVSMDQKIHVLNLETNAKTLLPHKESYDILKPVEVMLIKRYPEYEILDPNTYYQARLMNPVENLQINQKLKVVIDGGEAWVVKE